MSQYGDGDYCSVWKTTWRTAKKDHRCRACGEAIRVGDRYHYTFYIFDGDSHDVKRCARCQTILEHLDARIRKEGDPDEYCDEELNCGHEYDERWDEEPPEWLAALAFWRPGDPLPTPPTTDEGKAT